MIWNTTQRKYIFFKRHLMNLKGKNFCFQYFNWLRNQTFEITADKRRWYGTWSHNPISVIYDTHNS